MKNFLLKTLKDFLSLHFKRKGPLLVGVSGGEDSSALFSLLLELKAQSPFDFHVAHFDHAWREESGEEAAKLQSYVESFKIPFHMERSQSKAVSNLEDNARNERFAFFQKVYQDIQAEALVLAHQKEDQAETVLKRIFEGAGVFSLGGMQECSLKDGMKVWRPFLSIERKCLQKWNEEINWLPFKDRTNWDLKFLRPRMREDLFPLLESGFGKNIRNTLYKVGEELSLFKNFFYGRWEPALSKIKEEPLGCVFPVSDLEIQDLFEKQEVVRLFLQRQKATASSAVLKKIVNLLSENASNKQLDVSVGSLLVERGSLIWLKKEPYSFQGKVSFKSDCFTVKQGSASWDIQRSKKPLCGKETSLMTSFLRGQISYRFKEGSSFSSYENLTEKDQKKISGYLSKNKIPAKMKRMFPFIINNVGLVDFDFCFNLDLNCENSAIFSNIILKM